jgi:hypothetical protein
MFDSSLPPQRPLLRTVDAPSAFGPGAYNRVHCVILAEDEDVSWIWTSGPNGMPYVSGYTIIKRPAPDW